MQERNENICDTLTTGDTSEDIIHREKRTYQETENPEIFFVPIVWTNVVCYNVLYNYFVKDAIF